MSLKSILIAGCAFASLLAFAGSASADPYYRCNDERCYDDQAEQTRELNLMQLEHPGAGVYAVPGYRGHGMRHRDDDDERYGDDDDDRGGGYGMRGDDERGAYGAPDDGDDYGDDDSGDDDDDGDD